MLPDLKQLAFDQAGKDSLVTKALMMTRIKSLAVSVLHPAIHRVHLHEAKQSPDESTKTFAARFRGIAANCDLQVSCHVCHASVSYTVDTVYHIVMASFSDRYLQQCCTTQPLLNNVKNINNLVKYCNAHESGKLGQASTVGVIKSTKRNAQPEPYPKTNPGPNPTTCGYCAGPAHKINNREARAAECPAYGQTCGKCSKQDHNAIACKGGKPKPNQVNAIATAVQAEIQKALAAQPVEPSEIASYTLGTYSAFAIHHDETNPHHLSGLAT